MSRVLSITLLVSLLLILVYAPIALSAYSLVSRTLIQFAVLAMFAAWLLSQIRQNRIPLPGNLLSWLLTIVVLYLISSTIFSIYPHRSATELRSTISYFGIFVLTIVTVKKMSQIRTILWILAVLGGVLTLVGFVLLFNKSNTIFGLIPVHNVRQLASAFPNYNHFAAYLGMVIPGTVALWWVEKSPRRPMLLLLTGIMIAGLFFTLSRGGIGGFLVGMVLFVILLPKAGTYKKRWWSTLAILVITVVMMVLTVREPLSMRWIKTGEIIPLSRTTLWQTSLHAFLDRPVFGFGLGTFRIVFPFYNQNAISGYYRHALNDYLEWLSELGIVGFVLAAAMVIALFYSLVKIARKHRSSDMQIIVIASIISVLILLINALVNFPFHIPAISITLAALAAIPIALSSDENFFRYFELRPLRFLRWSMVCVVAIVALFLASEISRPFVSQQLIDKARIAWQDDEWGQALRFVQNAISWDPNDAQSYDTMGRYYQFLANERGDGQLHSTAIESFKSALELNSRSASYHYHLGQAYAEIGDYQQAKESLARSIELDDHYLGPPLKLIEVTILQGDTAVAIMQYRRLLTSDALRNRQILADACRNLKDVSIVAAIVDTSDVENQLTLASALIEYQRWEDCKTVLQGLLSRTDEARVWQMYLDVLHSNQEDLQWIHVMVEYLRRYPEDSNSQRRLIRALADSDIEFPTVDNYVKLAFPDTASLQYKMTVAGRLLKDRKYDRSGEVFFNVLETEPDNLAALMGLGQSYEYSKQYLEAILIYHRILKLQPDNIGARFRLGVSYRRQGMLAQAVEQLEECLKQEPENPKVHRQLSEIRRTLNLPADSTISSTD
jgi:putative inorganic carbon (HCO3(-)) transporter